MRRSITRRLIKDAPRSRGASFISLLAAAETGAEKAARLIGGLRV